MRERLKQAVLKTHVPIGSCTESITYGHDESWYSGAVCSSVTECATTMQLQHLQAACGARMPSKILRLPSVLEISGLSRSSIYLRVAQGIFPKQVSLGARAIGWRESDIQTWIECLREKS
jgi:prophage regulatory protein